jgi:superfamily I DNA/RNA helicase
MLWTIFERLRGALAERGLVTYAQVFTRLASKLRDGMNPPFDFVVIDEAQDLTVAQLRFLSALGAKRPNGLFFAGDLGQRIFQQPFSWKALGVDIRGRASTLRINYRTSHQIRARADRLLGPELSDVDGNKEERAGTVSTFNGPEPEIVVAPAAEDEIQAVSKWLAARCGDGVVPHEIGVFVRSQAELDRARAALERARIPYKILDDNVETTTGKASISTMHLAKGLEFRTVVVMACDDEVIPLQSRIEAVGDDSDLEEVYNTERHLLYVACTRARDHLLVTGVAPASEFLDDLRP